MPQDRLEDLYRIIGQRINAARKKIGFTQEELATKSGVTRPSIVHIERGEQRLPIDRLYRVAHSLNIHVFDLLPEPGEISDLATDGREELKVDSLSARNENVSQATQEAILKIAKERR